MNCNKIRKLIESGEGIKIEFKSNTTALSDDVFETICAFLNTGGGEILLGVEDDGNICGISPDAIDRIESELITVLNNPTKIEPSLIIDTRKVEIEGKKVLYVFVPRSSIVHTLLIKKKGKRIFKRVGESDIDITGRDNLIADLYLNKKDVSSETKIYQHCTLDDLDRGLIDRAVNMARAQQSNHPWLSMSHEEILRSAKLYNKDFQTGEEGINLAGILLFGKDSTIGSVLPHYRTDLIVRRKNLDRYDDRDTVTTNLIDSFDRIIAFGKKHLSDPFYLEGVHRISVVGKIFRELASNMLIHREYTKANVAQVVIGNDSIITENGNMPHSFEKIDIDEFTPYPKNPIIASVFKQLSLADELGSGVRNLNHYVNIYTGTKPELNDADSFEVIIPLGDGGIWEGNTQDKAFVDNEIRDSIQDSAQDSTQDSTQDERVKTVLEYCKTARSMQEIADKLELSSIKHVRNTIIKPLIESEKLSMTLPEKPNSKNQRYIVQN